MRIQILSLMAAVLVACGGDDSGNGPSDAGHDATIIDAPEFAPVITSLTASPTQVSAATC